MSQKVKKIINDAEAKIKSAIEDKKAAAALGGANTMTISSEKKLLNSFGAKNIQGLLDTNLAHPRFKHINEGDKAAALELKKDIDCSRMAAQILHGQPRDGENSTANVKGILTNPYAKAVDLEARVKAFGSEVTGSGDEWVPTAIAQNYIEEFHLELKLAKAFKMVNMPTAPFELPVQTSSTKGRIVGEGAAASNSEFGTEKLVFNAKKFSEYYILPEELNEDSAPAILQLARQEVISSVARGTESALLNGQSGDSDIAAGDPETAWKGLRKYALDASSTVDFGGSGVTAAKLNEMRKDMGKYGVNPADLAWIFGPSVYNQAQELDIVQTLDKFGGAATVLSGSLGKYNGIDVLVSEWAREDLNASGVHDGVTATMASPLLVNIKRFMMGMRRPIRVKAAYDGRAEYDRWQVVSYMRQSFVGHKQAGETYADGSTSTEKSVIAGINLVA